ncbi:hypothetical protein JCM33774_17160 [Actinophytocola sp. KF-1]
MQVLERVEAQLLQPRGLRTPVRQVDERRPTPQPDSLFQQSGGLAPSPSGEQPTPIDGKPLEPQGIDIVGRDVEPIPTGGEHDGVHTLAQPGHMRLNRTRGTGGRIVPVLSTHDRVDTGHTTGIEGERHQQSPRPRPTDDNRHTIVTDDLKPPEHPDPHAVIVSCPRQQKPSAAHHTRTACLPSRRPGEARSHRVKGARNPKHHAPKPPGPLDAV